MKSTLRTIVSIVCLTSLAACSGGGPGPVQQVIERNEVSDPIPPQLAPDNPDPAGNFGTEPPDEVAVEASSLRETLAAVGDVDTPLRGIIIVGDTDTRTIVRRDGVYSAADATLSLADLDVTLSKDIPGAFLVSSGLFQAGGAGIVGIATPDADMPLAGNATYSGGAAGFVITPASGFDLTNGKSLVTIAFDTGFVTATLSDFTSISQVSGNLLTAPVSEIILRNAQINASGFSGGALETRDGFGDLVDLTGSNTGLQAEGQFFGINAATGLPTEVGGLVLANGDNGIVFGSFIAD